MTNEEVKRFWSIVFFDHPLPIGTRVKCRDKRFTRGYVSGTIILYSQASHFYRKGEALNLREPWCYKLKINGWYQLYKRSETVIKIL